MPEALYLSHWDAAMPILVPDSVVQHLSNYQILAIRFLYNNLQKGYRGAILNEPMEMNPYIQISAFLNAVNSSISIESPAIILCTMKTFGIWHYHLSNFAGNTITVLSERNSEQILQSKSLEIILSTVDSLKWLKGAELDFFTVVIDDLDIVLNKRFVKQIKGQYHIGITGRNFLSNPDQKLFRGMLLWANPDSVGKLEEFCEEDNDHLNHNRFAYGDYWLRLTWSFCETFKKPTDDDLQRNQAIVDDWLHENNIWSSTVDSSKKREVRKRKRESVDQVKEEIISLPPVNEVSNDPELENEVGNVDPEPMNEDVEDPESVKALGSSQETIIYDYDDCPILSSIMNNDGINQNSKPEYTTSPAKVYSALFDEPKSVKQSSSEDILLSIMSDDFKEEAGCSEYSNKNNHSSLKNDVLSMLFSDSE